MAALKEQTRQTLYSYFETGDRPNQEQFEKLIDSFLNKQDDGISVQNGKIGIGTIAPKQRLSVIGSVRGAFNNQELEYTELGHGGENGYINTKGDGNLDFRQDGQTKMSLTGDGKLGIGTIAPKQRLSVIGSVRGAFNNQELEYAELGHGGENGYINTKGDGNLDFRHDGQTKMSLTGDGKLGIGTIAPKQRLSVIGSVRGAFNNQELEYTELGHGGENGYINTKGDGNLDFRHDGQTKMSLTGDGKLGIGTIAPKQRLSVIGSVRGAFNNQELEYTELGHGGENGYINTKGDGNLDFRHDGQTKMSLTGDGKLGIGTTAPKFGQLMIKTGRAPIAFEEGQGKNQPEIDKGRLWRLVLDGGNMRFDVNTGKEGEEFGKNYRYPLFLGWEGNVGIGTGKPLSKLHLKGGYLLVQRGANTKNAKELLQSLPEDQHGFVLGGGWKDHVYFYWKHYDNGNKKATFYMAKLKGEEF